MEGPSWAVDPILQARTSEPLGLQARFPEPICLQATPNAHQWSIESRRLDQVGNYVVLKEVGRGNFATVRMAKHDIARTKVALKVVDRTKVGEENLHKIEREIEILKALEHPNIVKLYEILRSERYIYIVTEYCSGGELFEVLYEKGRITEAEARKWFLQTAAAVQYCHERGVVHRDLKAENVLLDKDNNVKIIDFGFSNYQRPGELLNTWCGSPPYAAPELLLGKDYDGTKADIWSLGVLLYILVTGGFPFPGDSIDKLKRAVLTGQVKIPYYVSVECSDLLRKMLVLNASKRLTIQGVMQHRWTTIPVQEPRSASAAAAYGDQLLNTRIKEKRKMDPTVMVFLQQHSKWSEEQIVEEVSKRNYDGPIFAAYELLCDKVARQAEHDVTDHARRGSRGSILSGKANVEPEPAAPIISAHHLAQLNLSTSAEYDSDDSSASDMCDDSPCSSSRKKETRHRIGEAMPSYNAREHRRHTLCATEPLLPPGLSQLGGAPPLNSAAAAHLHHTQALNAALGHPNPLLSAFHGILPGLSPLPISDMPMLHIPNLGERRASASEALFAAHLMSSVNNDAATNLATVASGSGAQLTIEEEGMRYLSQHGSTKRNTVHGLTTPFIPSATVPNTARHLRSPYQKTANGERRSSWASPSVTAQQQAQLEKLYRQSIGACELIQLKQLQKEFQQLGQMTGGCSPSRSPSQQMDTSSLSLKCTPRISITDENNRSLQPPGCSSATFDPVTMFDHKVTEVLFREQRPATVIGFSSTSGASTPEHPYARPESRGKTIICAAEPIEVIHEAKVFCDAKQIPYEEAYGTDEKVGSVLIATGVARLHIKPAGDRTQVEIQLIQDSAEPLAEELVLQLMSMDNR